MKHLLLIPVSVVLAVACSKDSVQMSQEIITDKIIYATANSDSRTYFEDNGDDNFSHRWSDSDEIGVFDKSTAAEHYILTSGANTAEGTFLRINIPEAGRSLEHSFAVYPYSTENNVTTDGVFRVNFPAVQTFYKQHPDSYGRGCGIMVAQGENNCYSFKNVCGFLRISLTGGVTIKRITLAGNNDEPIAGEGIVNYKFGTETSGNIVEGTRANKETPTTTMFATGAKEITLDCGDGIALSEQATAFVFALPPTGFKKGFTVKAYINDYKYMAQRTDKAVAIARNTIHPMAVFAFTDDNITFADYRFEKYCVEHFDTDGNGLISATEAAAVETIDCANMGITDLGGIEHFTGLKTLDCSGNQIAKIDLSHNNALTNVTIEDNSILKRLIIWEACTSRNNFLHFDMGNVVIRNASGDNFGYPYQIGQFIPWYGGGVVYEVSATENSGKLVSGLEAKNLSYTELAEWARAYGDEWYIPSEDELRTIFFSDVDNLCVKIDNALNAYFNTRFSPDGGYYWTSTPNSRAPLTAISSNSNAQNLPIYSPDYKPGEGDNVQISGRLVRRF